MLAAIDRHLCGCSTVLVAKALKVPPTIDALWEFEDWTTEQIDKSWQRLMGSAVEQTRQRSLTTVGAVDRELKRLEAVARAFGRSPGLEKLINELNKISFALGAIYIGERDAEIRKTNKLPPPPKDVGFRVNEEPRLVEKAGKSKAASISAGFNFSQEHLAAIENLDNQALLWFRDIDGLGYSDPKTRAAILATAERQIASGASGYAVASSLADEAEKMFGTGAFAGRGLTYWGGVSENAATIAAVRGELIELAAYGWNRYEIVNPMDERTTPICSMLNGKTVLVPHAIAAMEALDGATSIDEVKELKPWPPGGSGSPVAAATGSMPAGSHDLTESQSQALANAGSRSLRTTSDVGHTSTSRTQKGTPGSPK